MNFNNTLLNRLFRFTPEEHNMENSIFDVEAVNTSTENEFIPIINYNASRWIGDNVSIYYSLGINNVISFSSKGSLSYIPRIVTNSNAVFTKYIKYKEKGIDKVIYIGLGFILDEEGNILFLAAFRNNLLMQYAGEDVEFTNRDVKIFITTTFMNEYRKIYNIINRNILQSFLESGCELSISNSELIKDIVYGNEFERLSNFETVEDKLSFIEAFRNTILENE